MDKDRVIDFMINLIIGVVFLNILTIGSTYLFIKVILNCMELDASILGVIVINSGFLIAIETFVWLIYKNIIINKNLKTLWFANSLGSFLAIIYTILYLCYNGLLSFYDNSFSDEIVIVIYVVAVIFLKLIVDIVATVWINKLEKEEKE